MHPKLAWFPLFVAVINKSTMGIVHGVYPVLHADPLKKPILLKFSEPLQGQDYHSFMTIAYGFARANDCIIERVEKHDRELVLHISIKNRVAKEMSKNPFLEETPSSIEEIRAARRREVLHGKDIPSSLQTNRRPG